MKTLIWSSSERVGERGREEQRMPARENTSEVRQVMAEQVIGRRGNMYEKMKKKVVTRRIIHLPHADTR